MGATGSEGAGKSGGRLERLGVFLFASRNWLFTAGLLGLLAGFRPVLFWHSERADTWMNLFGLGLTLAGQGLRMAVIGYSPVWSGGTRKRVDAEQLLTTGLFAHVRNPLYIGNLLVVVGLAAIHNNPWVYGVGVPLTLLGYSAIVAAEEGYLLRRFGPDYGAYCRQVPRWVPRLRGLTQSLAGISFDGRRVVLQEYGSVYIALALPLALMLYEHLSGVYGPVSRGEVGVIAGLLAAATLAWGYLRRVKLREVARRKQAKLAEAT
ncbi:MAG TPA: isoprenylcysteine carboxylmethyltransferase family protein [Armatimonadota bacterium]|nr:isoprenylcysteine carboxylmethyltransferase family protein [Armatimonadota bacterium]